MAINDKAGILDIPKLKEKYKAGECVSYFRMQKDYSGTEKCGSDLPKNTGETLYLGSTSSELYMCAYQKNYEFLAEIFSEIRKKNKTAVLVCVGDEGGMKEIVLEKFKKLKVMDSLRLLGIREDVAQIMQMFDVFVLPSRWEGLGIVYIEAQAAGVQTFASDVVPKEAKVTELLHYISLKKSPEVWAREILKYENGYVKRDTTEEIKKKGYNIQTITKRLEDIYLNNKN